MEPPPPQSIAVVASAGIGDALLMQICAHRLREIGHQTTLFSDPIHSLSDWFPNARFAPRPTTDTLTSLNTFDAILLQHDNSPLARQILQLPKPTYLIYGAHDPLKHPPLRPSLDFLCSKQICIAQNIQSACSALFHTPSKNDNGITPLPHLIHRKFNTRVAIHTGSSSTKKNWLPSRFHKLQNKLIQLGFAPCLVPTFPTLSELASFLYESAFFIGNDSGPGHLASNLNIPTITIGSSREQLTFWRPGWGPNRIVYPHPFFNKTKLTRENWKYFITTNQVLINFLKLNQNPDNLYLGGDL